MRVLLAFRNHLRKLLDEQLGLEHHSILANCFRGWRGTLSHQQHTGNGDDFADAISCLALQRRKASHSHRLSVATHLFAYQRAAAQARYVLRAAKRAYLEELGQSLAMAAESYDTKAAYEALRRLVPAVRKKSGQLPAVPILDKHHCPFPDEATKAGGWADHFGGLEGGHPADWGTLRSVHLHHCHQSRRQRSPLLCDLPDKLQWEQTFRRVKRGKAPGPDGLDHDSLTLALGPVTKMSFPLVLKVATGGAEPLSWRGGEVLPFFKGKGSGQCLDQYRSILLSNSFAKRWHAWLRKSLLPTFATHSAALQCGATGGSSTAALSLLVRTFQHHCRERRLSHALIFVDLRSAFYSVVREFLLSKPPADLDLLGLCTALGLTDEQVMALVSLLDPGGDNMSQAVPQHLKAYLADLLACTWFQVRGADHPIQTHKGTRPGDPLADLLFSMCIAGPLQLLAREMRDAGARIQITCGGILPGVPPGHSLAPATVSWHDDVVAMVAVSSAAQLLDTCASVARCIHDLFALRGLSVNYDAGKSEAVCTPIGPGIKPVLRRLRHPQGCSLYFLPDQGNMQALACVDAYRHLGSMLHDSGSLMTEIRRRLQQARIALQPLKKPLMGRKDLTQRAKHNFFRSYVVSRLLHNVGAWSSLQIQEQHAWQSGILGLYKAMRPRPITRPDEHWLSADLCRAAICPAPLALVRIERLRLAGPPFGTFQRIQTLVSFSPG